MDRFIPEYTNWGNVRKRIIPIFPCDVEDMEDVEQLIIILHYLEDLNLCDITLDEYLLRYGMLRLIEYHINKLLQ